MTNNVFLTKLNHNNNNDNNNNNNNTKIKHNNPCRRRELNTGPLAPLADALPLHHLESTENIDGSQAM